MAMHADRRGGAARQPIGLAGAIVALLALSACDVLPAREWPLASALPDHEPLPPAPTATVPPSPVAPPVLTEPTPGYAPPRNELLVSAPRGLVSPELYAGTGDLAKPAPSARSRVAIASDGRVTLNFVNAEIREVVAVVLGETLNVSYTIDPRVEGTVTVRTSEPLPRSAVIPALESAFALSAAAIVSSEGLYRIVPIQEAGTGFHSPAVSASTRRATRGFGTQIIPLRYVSAAAMREILQPFVPQGRTLQADGARNLLIYAGTGVEARDLLDMVQVFDVDWMAGMSFGLFPVRTAEAKALVTDLDAVFGKDGGDPLAGAVRFVPIERLNAVLVITAQPDYLRQAELWIERLDRGEDGDQQRIYVYYVQNKRAEDLGAVLGQVFETSTGAPGRAPTPNLAPGQAPVELRGSSAPTPASQESLYQAQLTPNQPAEPPTETAPPPPRPDGTGATQALGEAVAVLATEPEKPRIIVDEINNALVILATPPQYKMIQATLRQLDIIPLQVLIEATIAEVTLNDTLSYGVQWFLKDNLGEGTETFTFSAADGTVLGAFPGFSYLFTDTDIRVAFDALRDITDLKVISSPQILVLDNQSATLQVGDQVPIATQSAVSVTDPGAPIVNSIQFRDTGVNLEVTPRVNASGLVVLDIVQEVSDAIPTLTSDIDSPTIQQRTIKSTVAVHSGETIALGGLIRDSSAESELGIPLLMDIPVVGNLFKVTSSNVIRIELLVLITPRVIRDQQEARNVTAELRRRLRALGPLDIKIR
jgi:general secretion pathway protein D